jgi:prenyltransferase beta subunit
MFRAGRNAAAGKEAACRWDSRFGAQSGSDTHQAKTACAMMNIGYGPTKQTISLTRLFKWIMTRQMEIRSGENRDIRMQKLGFARGGRL